MRAFFPFQRDKHGHGRPVGGRLSDFHGCITAPDFSLDAAALLQQTGLATWNFSHVPVSQQMFREHYYQHEISPCIDLRRGFDEYAARLGKSQFAELKKRMRRARQIEREIGPLRLEIDSPNPAVLQMLMTWKSAQFRETGMADVFSKAACGRSNFCITYWKFVVHSFPACFSTCCTWGIAQRPFTWECGAKKCCIFGLSPIIGRWGKYSPGRVLVLEMARAAERIGN